jgi:hypothetical protein
VPDPLELNLRWHRCLYAPGILFVAVEDVLACLDYPDELREALENLGALDEPVPDTVPEDWT